MESEDPNETTRRFCVEVETILAYIGFRDKKKPLTTRVWLAFPRAASAMMGRNHTENIWLGSLIDGITIMAKFLGDDNTGIEPVVGSGLTLAEK